MQHEAMTVLMSNSQCNNILPYQDWQLCQMEHTHLLWCLMFHWPAD